MMSLIAVLACAALAGCGDETIVDPEPVPSDRPLITYARSGGIAFMVQELVVNEDGTGTLTLQEGEKPETIEVELTDSELASLRVAVGAVDPSEIEAPEIACADCYVYQLEFPDGETLEFAEFPEPQAELDELLSILGAIVDAHSPPNPTGA